MEGLEKEDSWIPYVERESFIPKGHNKPHPSSSDPQEHRSCKPDQYIKRELEKYFEQKMLTVHPSPVTALILNQETVRNNHKYIYTGAVKTEAKPNP